MGSCGQRCAAVSLIRTESDEATYNLHILLRFELEQAMLSGDLSVREIPAAWNERMKKYLGLTPPDDAQGCLQDVHWSGRGDWIFSDLHAGESCTRRSFLSRRGRIGDLDGQFARGEFAPLLAGCGRRFIGMGRDIRRGNW